MPPPPPVVRPNPWPRAPVSVRAGPSCGSGPVVGVRPVASSGARSGRGRGLTVGEGSVISGGFAAGGVSARRTFSGGACTVRPPMGVMPPARGPGAPPRLMVITVRGSSSTCPRQLAGMKPKNSTIPMCAPSDHATIFLSPSGSRLRATRRWSIVSFIARRAAWRRCRRSGRPLPSDDRGCPSAPAGSRRHRREDRPACPCA